MMDIIAAEIEDEYCGFSDDDQDREDSPGSDDWGLFLDPGNDLSAGRQALGLTRNYVPDWTTRDAFREFIQNWKDDIIEKNRLEPEQFLLDIEDTKDAYTATVRAPDLNRDNDRIKKETVQLLGFMRYSKKDGTLQLTNFKSHLTRAALGIGFTTKREKKNLAGTHGEGFKVASLVMVNKGYQVRIEASRFYWKFKYFPKNPHNLYCVLSAASEKKIQKDKEKQKTNLAKGLPRGLTANIWEDVTVRIGKVYRPWSESASIKFADFQSWLKVSLDIERPSRVIRTSHGSLILDPEFQGRLYLRELLLEINNPLTAWERKFRFAYNLAYGRVNRDRQSLSSSAEEARGFALIWKEAIQKKPDDTLKEYIELLREDDHWADVNRAKDYIDEVTANAIWQYLLREDPDRKRFYYDHKSGEHDVELIRKSLKREPAQLSSSLWDPLRRWGLVRTPREQQYHLLRNAPVAHVTETLYSLGVRRSLSAALAVDKRTRELNLTFRSGYTAGMDLLIDESNLLVHERCLQFHAGHDTNSCRLASLASSRKIKIEIFSCDHIVMELYELVLDELMKSPTSNGDQPTSTRSSLYLKVSESLMEMPRKIEIAQGPKTGEVEVSWVDFASDMVSKLHGLNIKGRIILHRESTCFLKRFELLAPEGIFEDETELPESDAPIQTRQSTAVCGCPEQIVSQRDSRTTFHDLDLSEEYFPMVARMNSQAFFGLPPPGLRPKGREETTFTEPQSRATLKSHPPRQAHFEDYDGNDDLYGVSDGEGDYMQIDLPYRSSPCQGPSAELCSTSLSSSSNSIPFQPLRSPLGEISQTTSPSASTKSKTEKARLQDEIRALREQLNDAKRQLRASGEDLENTNANLKNMKIDFDLKDELLLAKTKECQNLQNTLNSRNQLLQQVQGQCQSLIAETQKLGQAHDALNGQLRDANTERQNLRLENQALQGTQTEQQRQLEAMRDESHVGLQKLEDAQSMIALLCKEDAEDTQTPELRLQSQEIHASCVEEIELLQEKVQQLRKTRDTLKAELKEAQRDAREGHASTREALRHMMSLRESESQPPGMAGRAFVGEAPRSAYWSRVKRESQSVDEGEEHGTMARGSKRVKQEYIIDLTD